MNNITIIGGGNLGVAIAAGLLKSNFIESRQLTVTRRNTSLLQPLADKGVTISNDNVAAVGNAKYIILAVKPYQVKDIIQQVQPVLTSNHVLISVITGVSLNELKEMSDGVPEIIRAMPNTAISIQESMTCLAYHQVNDEHLQFVTELFNRLGSVLTIDEGLMNAATVLGACGTAFAMRYIRANIQAGIEIGFSAQQASFIAAQTIKGAAQILEAFKTHPEQEIDKVTTPKGCTIAGLNEMEHQGFSSALIKGVIASYKKIV